MTTTRERYDGMITTTVGAELHAREFRKGRNAFFREIGRGWQLIDFQASQFGTRDEISFTINLGISFGELRTGEKGPPSLGRAHIRQRIGRLLDANEDFWWNLDRASDFDAVATEVNIALVSKGIPWLEARSMLDQVLAETRRDPSFIESWHLARLSALTERSAQPELAGELRLLSQRGAD
jgi:hypothetical protein